MRLLLDTHVVLWSLDDRLDAQIGRAIRDADDVLVSSAVVWEIAIKQAAGRLEAPPDFERLITDSGFTPLAITFAHASHAGRLPRIHGDPFDRMLVAQAQLDGLTLATADATLARYDVPVLSVSPA